MPTRQFNSPNRDDIDRPTCRMCGSHMWLARVSQPVDGRECRTFECPVCEVSTGNNGSAQDDRGASTPI